MCSSQRMLNFIRKIYLPVTAAALWYYGSINDDLIAYMAAGICLIQ